MLIIRGYKSQFMNNIRGNKHILLLVLAKIQLNKNKNK